MRCSKEDMRLYAITDRSWLKGKSLVWQVEEALKGGATCIQLREKELDADAFLKAAFDIKALCQHFNVPFFINDNVDIAIKCGADGIHVGQQDMAAIDVRARIGDQMMLGISAQTVEQAVSAQKNGADCLGVGAVFATATKLDADSVSHQTLKAICDAVTIPVVAIGGINKSNMMSLAGTGVDGVALVSAIFASDNIENECRELLSLYEKMVKM
ncbi:thiamine phosphate synthase [Eubacteriaceae bacterium ES2]|nr:thiamine phosphate synthase [Eubacteriaceae bacterium ES2]